MITSKTLQHTEPTLESLDWLKPSHVKWPTNVKTLMSTRLGGYSKGAYASLNVGDHVGDDPLDVQKNRDQYHKSTGCRAVYLKQVHGADVVVLDQATPEGFQADASLTHLGGLACTIMVADCLPILITNTEGTLVGAAHAGWRGLAGVECAGGEGVVENLMTALKNKESELKLQSTHWLAWLGPCIGPKYFEVGAEVRDAFATDHPSIAQFDPLPVSSGPPKWLANLAGLAQLRLKKIGIDIILGNDSGKLGQSWCTVANSRLFFSHRRDKISGRMAASIWIDGEPKFL